ncbi:unnamed protein product [Spodoptera littoralis]|uniref:Eukaryotic translation initiation factor 5 n=2 Tax=Spodoptera littoralis TaxID=7109 RepID=A0A9P0N057_SPOLI|nr:unnamed protein product [Spodoptera littoralis]CAH1636718.1 unnamed protein product [Spodoptera littoralis]
MGSVNVNRNVADAFYRYKMPRICAKVEGKGNGIKTVIVNMPEVAKALGRPATYPTKYFGCELGAQTQFDFKNERFIVNGSHDSAKLQDLLDGFIRKFVLCPECDNPETELIVSTKRNTISQGCKACGYHGTLDFNHKLNTFILKNPPALDPSMQVYQQGSSLTEGNRGKRSKRSGPGAANGNHDGHDDAKNQENEAPVTPTTPNPKTSKKEKEKEAADDDDDGCWTVDVSEAAVRARMQDLTEGAKSMTVSEDSEKNEKQRMDLFYAYLKQRAASGDVDSNRAITEILHEAERLEVKSKAPLVMLEVLVRAASLAADVRRHRALLLRCTRADSRAQRAVLHALTALCAHHTELLPKVPAILKRAVLHALTALCAHHTELLPKVPAILKVRTACTCTAQTPAPSAVLHALTALCAHHTELLPKVPAILKVRTACTCTAQTPAPSAPCCTPTALCAHHTELLPKVPAILKLLYDEDIVEEKAILEWAAKPSRKYASKEVIADVRRRAAPFLEWLQQAEEDSSDGDDSEHDIEIEYDDRAKATPIKAVSAAPAKPAKPQDDDDVDVDIDAI